MPTRMPAMVANGRPRTSAMNTTIASQPAKVKRGSQVIGPCSGWMPQAPRESRTTHVLSTVGAFSGRGGPPPAPPLVSRLRAEHDRIDDHDRSSLRRREREVAEGTNHAVDNARIRKGAAAIGRRRDAAAPVDEEPHRHTALQARIGVESLLVAEAEPPEALAHDALDGLGRGPAIDARLPDANARCTDHVAWADRLSLARAHAVPESSERPEADSLAATCAALARAGQAQAAAVGFADRVAPHRAPGVALVAAAGVLVAPRCGGRVRLGAGGGREQAHRSECRRLSKGSRACHVRIGLTRALHGEARMARTKVRVAHGALFPVGSRTGAAGRGPVAVLRAG